MDKNIPLGLTAIYDGASNKTEVSWCYFEDADIDYFELEYYDDRLRKWVPFDGRSGAIKK